MPTREEKSENSSSQIDRVLLVVKATHMDADLADLLPLVAEKQGVVVITFWDKVMVSEFIHHVVDHWEQTPRWDLFRWMLAT